MSPYVYAGEAMLFGLRCFFDGDLCYAHEILFYWNVFLLEQLNSLIVLLPRHTVLSAIPFMVPGFYVLYYCYNLVISFSFYRILYKTVGILTCVKPTWVFFLQSQRSVPRTSTVALDGRDIRTSRLEGTFARTRLRRPTV